MQRYTFDLTGPCWIPSNLPYAQKETYMSSTILSEQELESMKASDVAYKELARQLCFNVLQGWTAPVGYFSFVKVAITKTTNMVRFTASLTVVDRLDITKDQKVTDAPLASLQWHIYSSLITAATHHLEELAEKSI